MEYIEMKNDSLQNMSGKKILAFMNNGCYVCPYEGYVFRLSNDGQWILTVDKDGKESRLVRTDTVTTYWAQVESAPEPNVERFTEQQRAFWVSLGGDFNVDGDPEDITGASFEKACRWWLAGGQAKHYDCMSWMYMKNDHVFFKDTRGCEMEWHVFLHRAIDNRWILKFDSSVLEKYHE